MFKSRPCGCKGVRTCLVCEALYGLDTNELTKKEGPISNGKVFTYCHHCNKAWEGFDAAKEHDQHSGTSYEFPGVLLIPEFLTEDEEKDLVDGCDSIPWDLSQSGRRKQNFGPKTNFKKRKINGTTFTGFPEFSKNAQVKMKSVPFLNDFHTIEQCALEYRVETGASIDRHLDDCWVWGERIISLSLLSDSVLTMNKFSMDPKKYNLEDCSWKPGTVPPTWEIQNDIDLESYPIVRIPMPRRSLLVLFGEARYGWEHSIPREDIEDRRICMAYREFTPQYLEGGRFHEADGKKILRKADNFGIHFGTTG